MTVPALYCYRGSRVHFIVTSSYVKMRDILTNAEDIAIEELQMTNT